MSNHENFFEIAISQDRLTRTDFELWGKIQTLRFDIAQN
jgi:hypothetical protein